MICTFFLKPGNLVIIVLRKCVKLLLDLLAVWLPEYQLSEKFWIFFTAAIDYKCSCAYSEVLFFAFINVLLMDKPEVSSPDPIVFRKDL